MPLDPTIHLPSLAVYAGALVFGALSHLAALVTAATSERPLPPRGKLVGHLFLAGLGALGVVVLIDRVTTLDMDAALAWIVAGVSGFAYGPSALLVLAQIGKARAEKLTGLTLPDPPSPLTPAPAPAAPPAPPDPPPAEGEAP